MSYDPNNIFAKILRGQAPCIRIFEDDQTLVIMDIMPQSEGHVLVLTKEPAAQIFELSEAGAAACMRTARKAAL
ncbi:MAG: HIT domain-containing protein, partial [Burkholderiales bacterium]|nr:HIT domain-containing protein [Burkholderiales bacterium]